MKHTFYDVKLKKKVELNVVDKVTFTGASGIRYALEGLTDDGRKVMGFVNKSVWESADV